MKKGVILMLMILFISCSDSDSIDDVQIRVANVSQFNYENIVVDASGDPRNFGNLNANETSDFVVFDLAFRIAFVELNIDGEVFTIQPIDFVGETPLSPGRYTYEISANDSEDQFLRLNLTLIEE